MKHLHAAAIAGALTFAGTGVPGQAWADSVALVIGNGDYSHAPKALTAVRDTTSVAEALEDAGWTVNLGQNMDRAGMRRLIEQFSDQVEDAESILIFYSGHAIRAGGVSFLAPVSTEGADLIDVVFDGVPLDLLLAIAARRSGQAAVFVDGAQLAGFTPQDTHEPGLADLEGPDGVLIVSAAEPGHAVRRSRFRDSRFARMIVDRFLSPGEALMAEVEAAPRPIWSTGSVDGDFALVALPEMETDGLEAEIELAYWRAAERSGKPEDYRAYLERYPNGIFATFARERLGLDDDADVPAEPEIDPRIQAERDLNLSRLAKRRIQEYLAALGHDPRGIDGLFGPGSRNAIKAWQRANDMYNEGWLTREQIELLTTQGEAAIAEQRRIAEEQRRIAEAEDNGYWSATGARGTADGMRAYLERYPEGLHAAEARAALAKMAEADADAQARRERRIFRRAVKRNTAEAYRDYLAQYPEGIYRDVALGRLDEIEGAERRAAEIERLAAMENGLNLSNNDRISVEQRLRFLGFEVGATDGVFDDRTRAGIQGYQASRGLQETGYLDRRTVVTLVRETNQRRSGQVEIDGAQVIRGLLDVLGGK